MNLIGFTSLKKWAWFTVVASSLFTILMGSLYLSQDRSHSVDNISPSQQVITSVNLKLISMYLYGYIKSFFCIERNKRPISSNNSFVSTHLYCSSKGTYFLCWLYPPLFWYCYWNIDNCFVIGQLLLVIKEMS